MLKRLSIILGLIVSFNPAIAQTQTSASYSIKLIPHTYFNCFTLDLPENLKPPADADPNNPIRIIVLADETDSVDVMIHDPLSENLFEVQRSSVEPDSTVGQSLQIIMVKAYHP